MMPPDDPRAVRDSYRTLRELAQDAIRRDILMGRLRPGERLNESQLAQRYGISRGPIREALRTLEGEGLLRNLSNRGAVVSVLSQSEVEEIFEMRFALERLAAFHGAHRIGLIALSHMSRLMERMSASIHDPDKYLGLNNEFHLTLYAASERPRLHAVVVEMMNSLVPYLRMQVSLPHDLMNTHSGHSLILEAATRHDADTCAELTESHLRAGAAIILRMLANDSVIAQSLASPASASPI